jgi:hypothetical protein
MPESREPKAPDPSQPQKMDSPFGPLMIFLIPLVALILYGVLSN